MTNKKKHKQPVKERYKFTLAFSHAMHHMSTRSGRTTLSARAFANAIHSARTRIAKNKHAAKRTIISFT